MDVIVYTKPGCANSQRIKDLLAEKGVDFQEHVCADGKIGDGNGYIDAAQLKAALAPVTVVDGVVIEGMDRAQIEQAIGWIGF